MADKKKLKMGQFAYDLKTNKAVFKIGTETYDVFPIDTELDKTSNNPIANKSVAEKFEVVDRAIEELTPYTLPIASAEVLGGIKIGEGLNITEEGILSANGGSGGGGNFKEVTKAYYDSLSDEEKKNGTVYFIKDWVPNI